MIQDRIDLPSRQYQSRCPEIEYYRTHIVNIENRLREADVVSIVP